MIAGLLKVRFSVALAGVMDTWTRFETIMIKVEKNEVLYARSQSKSISHDKHIRLEDFMSRMGGWIGSQPFSRAALCGL